VSKESFSERKSPSAIAFNNLEFWYQISFQKDKSKLPELPLNISTTSEFIGEVEIVKFLDNNSGEQLKSILINRHCDPEHIIVLDRKSGICKMNIFNSGNNGYSFSEDSGKTFTPIDRQTFTYLLENNMSLSEVRNRTEIENPQHIFFDENLWQSLGRGKIPDEFIGRITVDEFESIEASGFNYLDLATKDVIEVEYSLGSSEQSLSTKVGTYYITPCEVQGNTNYFFIPPFINYPRPDKIQLTKDQFFEALKNQQPPQTPQT